MIPIGDLVVILCWVATQVAVGFWSLRARPPIDTIRKYPRSVVIQSRIPFMKNWKRGLSHSDLRLFEDYRRRFFIQYIVFLSTLTLVYVYIWFKY